MDNFTYCNPTRIVFGRGTIAQLSELVPKGKKVLVTYGGGSIKSNAVYDQVMKALGGHDVIEFGGIPANPVYETLMKAVDLARREKVGFLLSVGGGSVLDGTKFIAAAVPFEGKDPWEIVLSRSPVLKKVLPLGSVLTLPATGSEMNCVAVVSRASTKEKLAFLCDKVFPIFSVLDPETTFSLPREQVRNGIVDTFVHVTEQYLNSSSVGALQARQAEAILQTLIERGPVTLERPNDYEARADFMWCATQALNGLIACGVACDWATHMIGHELTAFYGLAHAESLAAVLPHLLRHQIDLKRARLAQYGRRVWGIEGKDDEAIAHEAIVRTEGFFRSLGMQTRLAGLKIPVEEAAERVRERFAGRGTVVGEGGSLKPEDVAKILKRSC
jgi:NADP-dependent alcohol dehydrogenase